MNTSLVQPLKPPLYKNRGKRVHSIHHLSLIEIRDTIRHISLPQRNHIPA